MVTSGWEQFLSDEIEMREPMKRREDRGAMPVSRESKAHAAAKATWRSRVVSRKLGRQSSGMRNRRQRRTW